MDATFSLVSNVNETRQVFIISIKIEDETDPTRGMVVPILYVYMRSKKKSEYKMIWEGICSITGPLTELQFVTSDFEQGSVNAMQEYLPWVKILYCSFHYKQITNRRIHKLGLSKVYKTARCIPLKSLLHSLQTLPLANVWLLKKVTELLSEEIASIKTSATENKWARFETYLKENFLNPNSRFSMSIWSQSHYDNITTGSYDRSNNASESINSAIAKCHSSNKMTIEESISAIWTFQRSNPSQFALFNRGFAQLNPQSKRISCRLAVEGNILSCYESVLSKTDTDVTSTQTIDHQLKNCSTSSSMLIMRPKKWTSTL